jgi:transcription elongation factor GreA
MRSTGEVMGVIHAIAEARAHGDLKENAEYHAAREQQGFIEGRIKQLEAELSHAQVIDVASLNAGSRIVFGATVELADADSGEEKRYQIVGDLEADIKQGLIAISSPVARALIGKHEGDVITIEAPAGSASTRSSRSVTRAEAMAAPARRRSCCRRACDWRAGVPASLATRWVARIARRRCRRTRAAAAPFRPVAARLARRGADARIRCGDAARRVAARGSCLRAPDINGCAPARVRRRACNSMQSEADALLQPLRPLFGDTGFRSTHRARRAGTCAAARSEVAVDGLAR